MASSNSGSSSSAFDTYYQEFSVILRRLEGPPLSSSSSSSSSSSLDNKNNTESSSCSASEEKEEVEESLLYQQCVDLLSLMQLEARTDSNNNNNEDIKFERLERVKIYKFQLEAIKQKRNKDFLMGGAGGGQGGQNAFQMLQLEKERQQIRNILEQNESRASQQNELLERAMQSIHETEAVGQEILQETQRNRETIESVQGHVDELNGLATKASRLVKKLSRPWWVPRR